MLLTLPAINVQAPWADLLISGKKTVETRFYPLPQAYRGRELLIIETPGKQKGAKRRVAGIITFSDSFEYPTKSAFYADRDCHLVDESSEFSWDDSKKRKWGWKVGSVRPVNARLKAGMRTGILFTRALTVELVK